MSLGLHFPPIEARKTEWGLAFIMAGWGVMIQLGPVGLIAPFFGNLFHHWSAASMGSAMAVIGMSRLIVLGINGRLRRSPYFRALGSCLSLIFWATIALALWLSGIPTPGWVIYPVFLAWEGMDVWSAGRDARKVSERYNGRA